MSGDLADRIRALSERQVSAAELRETIERPLSDAEREEVLALARWFRRRYVSGAERLAYVRQAYARWRRSVASHQ
jgi:hypothetical protein